MIDAWIAAWREASPGAQGGICLECRSVLAEGESCHGQPAATWTRWAGLRKARRASAPSGGGGSMVASSMRQAPFIFGAIAVFSLGVVLSGDLAGLFGLVMGAGGAVLARRFQGASSAPGRRWFARARPVPEPGGVPSDAVLPEPSPALEPRYGRVTGADGPLAVEERVVVDRPDSDLVFARFGRVLAEVTVVLDDGTRVRLPAGRVCLLDEGGHTEAVEEEDDEGTRLDRIELRAGDRVTLVAAVEPDAGGARRVVGVAVLTLHEAEEAAE